MTMPKLHKFSHVGSTTALIQQYECGTCKEIIEVLDNENVRAVLEKHECAVNEPPFWDSIDVPREGDLK